MSKIDFHQYLIEFDTLDSTNQYLKKNYTKLPNYTIVKTKFQTEGHGQFGREWESNDNENLLFSLLIKNELPFISKDANPIIVSALLNLLEDYGIDGVYEYPNDIYIGDKKVAGILIETKYENKDLEYMVIGIGLNINQLVFLNPEATSLRNIINRELDINQVFRKLLKHLSNSVFLANLMYLGRANEN